ncbi:MAG: hypothetical protein DKINENOH_04369 [bacterium]|nr:hypothetical protein [bacterium]
MQSRAEVGIEAVAVGTTVARRLPRRSRRAVFPHRAHQRYSLPQSSCLRCSTSLLPAGRLACMIQICVSRNKFPLQVSYHRQPLRRVGATIDPGIAPHEFSDRWADRPCTRGLFSHGSGQGHHPPRDPRRQSKPLHQALAHGLHDHIRRCKLGPQDQPPLDRS